jgi:hypothetical protein
MNRWRFRLYLWRRQLRRLLSTPPVVTRRPVNRQLPYQRPVPHRPYRYELDLG